MTDDNAGLVTWHRLLGERTQAAQQDLARLEARRNEELARLQGLEGFRAEHLAQLRGGADGLVNPSSLRQAHHYLATVEQAIVVQQQRVGGAEQASAAARERLAAAHREELGVTRVLEAREASARQEQQRREQRSLDDLSQSRAARQGDATSGKAGLRFR